MDAKKSGLLIQSLRKEKRYTQGELAELIGVTDKAISRWETGEGFPEITLLPRLAEILGVSTDEILRGEKIKNHNMVSKTHIPRFKMFTLISSILMWFGLIFSVFLVNIIATERNAIWYGLIPVIVFNFVGLILYIIFRGLFLEKAEWNEEEKWTLYGQSRLIYSSMILSILLYIPYIFGHYFYLRENGIIINIIPFDWYLLWAIIALFISLAIILVVSVIHKAQYEKKKLNASIYMIFGAILAIDIIMSMLTNSVSVLFIKLQFYFFAGVALMIYNAVKKDLNKLWLILMPFALIGLAFSLLLATTGFNTFNQFMNALLVSIIFSVVLIISVILRNKELFNPILVWTYIAWVLTLDKLVIVTVLVSLITFGISILGNQFIKPKQKIIKEKSTQL